MECTPIEGVSLSFGVFYAELSEKDTEKIETKYSEDPEASSGFIALSSIVELTLK